MNQNPREIWGGLGNKMFQFAYLYSAARKGLIPDVYVQNHEYFKDFEYEIKSLYSAQLPEKTDMVAIHVRRGDYVDNSFYIDLMETPYYRDAMALFPNEKFLVFSDDIDWCSEQEIFKDCEFSADNTEIDDLNLMASCIGHIIANSSFSWWAAYISPYSSKRVAPKAWYNDQIERTICPNEWIRI